MVGQCPFQFANDAAMTGTQIVITKALGIVNTYLAKILEDFRGFLRNLILRVQSHPFASVFLTSLSN